MQKKMIAIIVLLLGMMLFFIFQNSSLKNENLTLAEQNEQLKNEDVHEDTNKKAKEVANDFINGYFNYQDKPVKQEVESYATNEVLEQLRFDDAEGLEEVYGDTAIEKVQSSVESLSLYEGQSLDDRVEIVALFDNRIEVNDTSSVAMTILTLEMVIEEDQWKVANLTYTQQ
ncbi:hypothetical protein [Shouchella lehensis]|uniref:RGS domain-containing protein n=1 Tax=Shouchella lehensis TaxID=300825 RepID=A0A4Y7WKX8_9BACI|nr:hypothetical protein [Shouchella lehensis]MBG9783455.1 hypothetical protein [Shouchella lehensis]TES49150.1 hypothetical protein E2L03_06610 [Shouchella lehensis]